MEEPQHLVIVAIIIWATTTPTILVLMELPRIMKQHLMLTVMWRQCRHQVLGIRKKHDHKDLLAVAEMETGKYISLSLSSANMPLTGGTFSP
jgi:hypothetical protein